MKSGIRSYFGIGMILVMSLMLSGCAFNQADSFVPLPPPVDAEFPMNQLVQTVGDSEQVKMQSPVASIDFGQTGDFAGAMKIEEVCLKLQDKCATMLSLEWGSWQSATIERAEAYDDQGHLLGGWVTQSMKEASLFQWLSGCVSCTIDRSRVIFEYISEEPGSTPILANIYYLEEWGVTSRAPLALGSMHLWAQPGDLFPEQSMWGFWETTTTPFESVVAALDRANNVLRSRAASFEVVDHDSAGRELIGRQTGLTLKENGENWGTVELTYSNTWGAMPNTGIIGKGALSRIEWIGPDHYYAVSVLSPAISPEPSSLFVFSENPAAADYVESNQQSWPRLYDEIRNGDIDGVEFAIYGIGHIGRVSDSVDGESVSIGQGGGVFYSTIGNPSFADVDKAYGHISRLGLGAIKALGLYYATWEMSGSGLEYYLATIRLVLADEESSLREYGLDVGTLDRVGYMPLP